MEVSVSASNMPRAKTNVRPKGRITAYAFFVQMCRREHRKKYPNENVIFTEFSKQCAERWKGLLDREKRRFYEMAEKDKRRYALEMEGYVPPKGERKRKRRRKRRDPNAPKRPLSAFFWFCGEERGKVKAMNPNLDVKDIARELGRRWTQCPPDLKSKYEAMAKRDRARYERLMAAYKTQSKSCLWTSQTKKEVIHEYEEYGDEDDED